MLFLGILALENARLRTAASRNVCCIDVLLKENCLFQKCSVKIYSGNVCSRYAFDRNVFFRMFDKELLVLEMVILENLYKSLF